MPHLCEAKTRAYGTGESINGKGQILSPSPSRYRREKGEPMKRLKRNRIQRAFDKGYQLGLAGRSKENCPFLTGLARSKCCLLYTSDAADD